MTETLTNGEILDRHGRHGDSIEHLDLPVPILTGPQAQGDVLIVSVAAAALLFDVPVDVYRGLARRT